MGAAGYPRIARRLAVVLCCLPLAGAPAASAPADDWEARAQALLERDARRLAATAAGQLDALLPPLFEDYHARLGDFAAWAFQWRTSYRLLRNGAFTLATLPLADPPRAGRLGATWDAWIATRFEELVLDPAGGLPALHRLHQRWRREWQTALAAMVADTGRTTALLQGRIMPRPAWTAAGFDSPSWNAEPPLTQLAEDVSGALKVRALRPLVTRLTLRAPIAAAVTAAGERLGALGGFGDLGLLGRAGQLVPTVAAFLGIDYLLSRIDAAIHQEALEEELHRGLEARQAALRTAWLAAAQAEIEEHLKAQRAFLASGQATGISAPAPTTPGTALPAPHP